MYLTLFFIVILVWHGRFECMASGHGAAHFIKYKDFNKMQYDPNAEIHRVFVDLVNKRHRFAITMRIANVRKNREPKLY